MRLVAVRAVLGDRCVFVRERPFLFRVALVADRVDRILLEVPLGLAVGIMAGRANHLAFSDRVVRRQRRQGVDLLVAFVTRLRLVDAHRQPFRAFHRCVTNDHYTSDVRFRVRIVAIRAGHVMQFV